LDHVFGPVALDPQQASDLLDLRDPLSGFGFENVTEVGDHKLNEFGADPGGTTPLETLKNALVIARATAGMEDSLRPITDFIDFEAGDPMNPSGLNMVGVDFCEGIAFGDIDPRGVDPVLVAACIKQEEDLQARGLIGPDGRNIPVTLGAVPELSPIDKFIVSAGDAIEANAVTRSLAQTGTNLVEGFEAISRIPKKVAEDPILLGGTGLLAVAAALGALFILK